jgi:hypothetical protein
MNEVNVRIQSDDYMNEVNVRIQSDDYMNEVNVRIQSRITRILIVIYV